MKKSKLPQNLNKQKTKFKLDKQELVLFSSLLYNSAWNGQQWDKKIKPLINKIAEMIDELEAEQA